MFHSSYEILSIIFFAACQNLGVIRVLYNYCVFDEQTEVVGEDAVEEWAKTRTLKYTHGFWKFGRDFVGTQRVSNTDALGVILQVRGKPGSVDAVRE